MHAVRSNFELEGLHLEGEGSSRDWVRYINLSNIIFMLKFFILAVNHKIS